MDLFGDVHAVGRPSFVDDARPSIAPMVAAAGITAAGSLLSGWLGNKNKNKQEQAGTSVTTPTMSPEVSPLHQTLIRDLQQRLAKPAGLAPGTLENGVSRVNRTFDNAQAGAAARNQAAGINGPAAAAPAASIDAGRAGAISDYLTQAPQQAEDERNQQIAQAMGLINLGRGSSTATTGSGTAQQSAGGGVAGGLEELASMVGFYMASGALGGGAKSKPAGRTYNI